MKLLCSKHRNTRAINISAATLLAAALLSSTRVHTACAQETRAKEFFQKDFAVQGGIKKTEDFFKEKDFVSRPQAIERVTITPAGAKSNNDTPTASYKTAPVDAPGPAVKSVGLVVAGNAPAHLEQHLQQLLDCNQRYGVKLGTVYALGLNQSMNSINQERLNKLVKAGGSFQSVWRLPKHLPVERSPSWILETEEGLALLEGVPLERYLTPQARFIPEGNGFTPSTGASF